MRMRTDHEDVDVIWDFRAWHDLYVQNYQTRVREQRSEYKVLPMDHESAMVLHLQAMGTRVIWIIAADGTVLASADGYQTGTRRILNACKQRQTAGSQCTRIPYAYCVHYVRITWIVLETGPQPWTTEVFILTTRSYSHETFVDCF